MLITFNYLRFTKTEGLHMLLLSSTAVYQKLEISDELRFYTIDTVTSQCKLIDPHLLLLISTQLMSVLVTLKRKLLLSDRKHLHIN